MEGARGESEGEFIIRPSKMVHPDLDITSCRQFLDCGHEHGELRFGGGQLGAIIKDLLRRLDPWNMRVAEDRQAIRVEGDNLIKRLGESGGGLEWEPIDQIDAD